VGKAQNRERRTREEFEKVKRNFEQVVERFRVAQSIKPES
jgi:hypothetical protein